MHDDITAQIHRVNAKEPGAQNALFSAAYGELRTLARSRLRSMGRPSSLDTVELVHESYFRFIRGGELNEHHVIARVEGSPGRHDGQLPLG